MSDFFSYTQLLPYAFAAYEYAKLGSLGYVLYSWVSSMRKDNKKNKEILTVDIAELGDEKYYVIEINTEKDKPSKIMSFFSPPEEDSINSTTCKQFFACYNAIMKDKKLPKKNILMKITTRGGDVSFALSIANCLAKHNEGKVVVEIDRFAFSGGTLIAIAADEIRMNSWSVLGPVDPQVSGFLPAKNVSGLMASGFWEKIVKKTCNDLMDKYHHSLRRILDYRFTKQKLRDKENLENEEENKENTDYEKKIRNIVEVVCADNATHCIPLLYDDIKDVLDVKLIQ